MKTNIETKHATYEVNVAKFTPVLTSNCVFEASKILSDYKSKNI
jgi:hypothetical protein